jgi:hypothetical protein
MKNESIFHKPPVFDFCFFAHAFFNPVRKSPTRLTIKLKYMIVIVGLLDSIW